MAENVGLTYEQVAEVYNRVGTVAGTAKELGISRGTVYHHLDKSGNRAKPLYGGRTRELTAEKRDLPKPGKVARYILTSAQNNTKVFKPFWENLVAFAKYHGAELMVSRYTYNKNAYGKLAVKPGTEEHQSDLWYDPVIEDYICDDRVNLTDNLVFCGEMNILPTAVKPLSGLEVYTGRASGIFPHAKIQMTSVASGKYEATKFNWTTGTVTQRNYIQKKEGLKAEFHHVYGAILAEVDDKGRWYVRQLNADKTGRFYDLDICVENGKVTKGHTVEAINWGDIHVAYCDPIVRELAWGKGGMLDTLKPKYQFMHDVLDTRAQNRFHYMKNLWHDRFREHVKGFNNVEQECKDAAEFLLQASRDWCRTIVVDSNHHNFLHVWLNNEDFRRDPENAVFFLECQLFMYKSIQANPNSYPNIMRFVCERAIGQQKNITYLDEDESFIICKDSGGGIECGMHGHHGPNGARGTCENLARMGRRANIGHGHSATIVDGVYMAGLSGLLDQGYNKGPSSWSHTHIVTYKNGKRAMVTMWQGKWRA